MSSVVYGIGGLVKVAAPALSGNGPPPASFVGLLGQQYFDNSQTPWVEYIYNSSTWVAGGNNTASTSMAGITTLTDNNQPAATKFYVDAQIAAVVVGAVPATSSTASATVTVTMNNRVCCATWTGFATGAASTLDLTIVNSTILTTSCIFGAVSNLNASTNNAQMTLVGMTQSAGQVIMHLKNNGAGALGAGDNVLTNIWVIS